MKDKTDILFREALRNRSCEPPAYVWNKICLQLERRKKNKKLFFWISTTAAGITFLFSVLLISEVKYKQQVDYRNWNHQNSGKSLNVCLGKEKENIVAEILSEISVIPSFVKDKIDNNRRKNVPVLEIKRRTQKSVIVNTVPCLNIKYPPIRTSVISLTNKENYKLSYLYQKILSGDLEKSKTKTLTSKNKKYLSLSGYFAPGYASGSRTHLAVNSRNYAYSKNQLSGIFSISSGLKFSVSNNTKLSFVTGIIYTQLGHRTKEDRNYPSIVMSSIRQPQSVVIASPLGYIKNNVSPARFYADYTTDLLGNSRSIPADIEQVFGALEIPFSIKYRLNDNKLVFNLLSGISGSFIVSNKAYLSYQNHREFIGNTGDIRTFNWSADMALGIEYPITSKIKFMIEPGFRYYLQSISKNEDVDFKPYLFSFSTGIGVSF